MKRSPLAVLALALLTAAAFTLAPVEQPAVAEQKTGEEAKQVLEETMATLGGTYRQVRRQMNDASKNADTADKLAVMIDASNRAKGAIPETATTDDLKDTYRVVMNKLIIVLAQAENAALEGDQNKLREYVLEANQVKGEGHELFIADDE